MQARYVHTNVIARDWRRLANFYITVFGCTEVPPQRDYRGASLDALLGQTGAHQVGMHLRLPGWGDEGPTLEVFSFDTRIAPGSKAVHREGYGHIAFAVDDVHAARAQVLAHGGSAIGEVVTLTTATGRHVTVCYCADPEGNALELQRWD